MLVKRIQEAFRAGDLYWPADLMVELENRRPVGTMEWAIECMKVLIENASPVGKEKYLGWLSELSLARQNPSLAELREKSLTIWHEERETFHTALSHLYAALVYFTEGNERAYRTTVIDALGVMGEHPFYRQTAIALPLALFDALTTEPVGSASVR